MLTCAGVGTAQGKVLHDVCWICKRGNKVMCFMGGGGDIMMCCMMCALMRKRKDGHR